MMDKVKLYGSDKEAGHGFMKYIAEHPQLKRSSRGSCMYFVELEDKTRLWFLGFEQYRIWSKGRTYLMDGAVYHSGWRVEGMM